MFKLSKSCIDFVDATLFSMCSKQYFKVRGPFVQILCIEKDSYMDTI